MSDPNEFRAGVGKLLSEVQRIKSEGDYLAAKHLMEAYGIHFDPRLRDEVLTRVRALNLPAHVALVMPKLSPVRDSTGRITDINITYPRDLTRQMLEYSGRQEEALSRCRKRIT